MSGLFDLISGALQGHTDTVASSIGTDPSTAQKAMTAALPVLLGALTRNASQPGGAEKLRAALERDHDGSVLQNAGQVLQNPDAFAGAGILKHLLGDRKDHVAASLGGHSGLDAGQMQKVLAMLAPLVLGGLGKLHQAKSADASALTQMLQGEAGALEARQPDLGGLLGLLDADHDGSILDDAARLGKGTLGSLFKQVGE